MISYLYNLYETKFKFGRCGLRVEIGNLIFSTTKLSEVAKYLHRDYKVVLEKFKTDNQVYMIDNMDKMYFIAKDISNFM